MCSPQIRLCLFWFRPIASKHLNRLTTIDTLSWLGGAEVTHSFWVWEVPASIPGSGNGFYVWRFVLLLLCFNFLSKHIIAITFCNFFSNVNLLSKLNILQDYDPLQGYNDTDLTSLTVTVIKQTWKKYQIIVSH